MALLRLAALQPCLLSICVDVSQRRSRHLLVSTISTFAATLFYFFVSVRLSRRANPRSQAPVLPARSTTSCLICSSLISASQSAASLVSELISRSAAQRSSRRRSLRPLFVAARLQRRGRRHGCIKTREKRRLICTAVVEGAQWNDALRNRPVFLMHPLAVVSPSVDPSNRVERYCIN